MVIMIDIFKIMNALEMSYIVHVIIAISIVILLINYKNNQIFNELRVIKDFFDDLQIKFKNSNSQQLKDTSLTDKLLIEYHNRMDCLDKQQGDNKEIINKLFIANYNKTEQINKLENDNKELKKQINTNNMFS